MNLPLVNPLPLTVLQFLLGMAAWVNALFFLGVGAAAAEGGANPLKTVGWISLVSGLGAFTVVWYLLVNRPAPLGDNAVAVAGLASIYALFFVALGAVEIGAPSIFQYSEGKSLHGVSEANSTRSPPMPVRSISISSQREPKPTAHVQSV